MDPLEILFTREVMRTHMAAFTSSASVRTPRGTCGRAVCGGANTFIRCWMMRAGWMA